LSNTINHDKTNAENQNENLSDAKKLNATTTAQSPKPNRTTKNRRKSAPAPLLLSKRPLTPPKSSSSSSSSTISSTSSLHLAKVKFKKIEKITLVSEIVHAVTSSSSQVTAAKSIATDASTSKVTADEVKKIKTSPNKPAKRARSSSTSLAYGVNTSLNQAKKLKKNDVQTNVNDEAIEMVEEDATNNASKTQSSMDVAKLGKRSKRASLMTDAPNINITSTQPIKTLDMDKKHGKKDKNETPITNARVKIRKRHSICGSTVKNPIVKPNIEAVTLASLKKEKTQQEPQTKITKAELSRIKKEKVDVPLPVEKPAPKKRGRKPKEATKDPEDSTIEPDEDCDESVVVNGENKSESLIIAKQTASEVDVEYAKLQLVMNVSKANICYECHMDSHLVECKGGCQRFYHTDCGVLSRTIPDDGFKCKDCRSGMHQCFACKIPATVEAQTKKCSFNSCGRYFHEDCAKANKLFRFDNSNSNKPSTFICPSHTCATCWIDMSHNLNETLDHSCSSTHAAYKGKLLKCTFCTTSYHASEYCLAAGSLMASCGPNIECPNHFLPLRRIPQHTK
jgi:hypothetical protein